MFKIVKDFSYFNVANEVSSIFNPKEVTFEMVEIDENRQERIFLFSAFIYLFFVCVY